MYVGYNTIYTVYGKVFGDTLMTTEPELIRLPTKQRFKETKTGFIKFIREASGVCNILHIVERNL